MGRSSSPLHVRTNIRPPLFMAVGGLAPILVKKFGCITHLHVISALLSAIYDTALFFDKIPNSTLDKRLFAQKITPISSNPTFPSSTAAVSLQEVGVKCVEKRVAPI